MLMDLFFETLTVRRKRRVHFHAFMADVHQRIHAWRQALKAGEVSGDDPIRPVAAALAQEHWILCFDEFAVTDIADAMILGGCSRPCSQRAWWSSRPPTCRRTNSTRAGSTAALRALHRAAEAEHGGRGARRPDRLRLEKLGETPVYFVPADKTARKTLDSLFARLTGNATPKPVRLMVQGHPVDVPAQAMGVARLSYGDVCQRPLGAADYIALARAYHTVIIDDVPVIAPDRRDEAKRLINLVDILYERHVKLIVSAQAEPSSCIAPTTATRRSSSPARCRASPRCGRGSTWRCRAVAATR
jgi:cell division protein ZapE